MEEEKAYVAPTEEELQGLFKSYYEAIKDLAYYRFYQPWAYAEYEVGKQADELRDLSLMYGHMNVKDSETLRLAKYKRVNLARRAFDTRVRDANFINFDFDKYKKWLEMEESLESWSETPVRLSAWEGQNQKLPEYAFLNLQPLRSSRTFNPTRGVSLW